MVQDDLDPYEVRKIRRAVCMESAPFCSYHLGDGNDEEITLDSGDIMIERTYFCHRYEAMYDDESKPPVDTHMKKLKVVDGSLTWE